MRAVYQLQTGNSLHHKSKEIFLRAKNFRFFSKTIDQILFQNYRHKHLCSMQKWREKNHVTEQSSEQAVQKNVEEGPIHPVQINIFQRNAYKRDLDWLHFDNKPKVNEKRKVYGQQPYITVSVAYPAFPCTSN